MTGILGHPFPNKCKSLHLALPITEKEAQAYSPFQALEAAYFTPEDSFLRVAGDVIDPQL